MDSIIAVYVTAMPVILGGIANMLFTKSFTYNRYKYPIDFGKKFIDGRRIFGDNKTYIGIASMMLFCVFFQFVWNFLCYGFGLYKFSEVKNWMTSTSPMGILIDQVTIGCLFGLAYMLFELPNSFIKRRINIEPGQGSTGLKGIVFLIIDQIDSMFGLGILVGSIADKRLSFRWSYVIVGGLTHLIINLGLKALKLRKRV